MFWNNRINDRCSSLRWLRGTAGGGAVSVFIGAAALVGLSGIAAGQTPVEVIAFQGGYGVDFFENAAKEFNALRPDLKVTLQGSPRAWDVLIPRFAAGTPPDLAWPGWGLNLRPIMVENQILTWDKYLDQPAYGGSGKTWRETFKPDILKMGQFDGKTYVLPYNIDANGWWYDKALFDLHGWTAPETFEELLVLGEKIKAKGIAPVTFTGRYPFYYLTGIYYPWVISAGGIEAYNAAINLEPGAWNHPAFLKAAQHTMDLKRRGYFQGGCIGMNHTESQMELLVGRAAMIPCGSWIVAEMKALLPPESELTYMKTPYFANGKGDPTTVYVSPDGKGWLLPTKGKQTDAAAEFYRYMSSPEKAAQFIEQKGTMTAIITEREPKMPRHLHGPYNAIKNAKVTWTNNINDWYAEFETEIETAFVDMYNELITPEQFVARVEAESQEYRKQIGDKRMKW